MNPSFHDVLAPFYQQALTVNTETNPAEVVGKILANHFQSQNGQETKDKTTLIKQLGFFWQLIPDLKWETKEKLVEGNKVLIRSVASGSPKGKFMGLDCDGRKSFKMDTMDLDMVENGQIVRVYHVEDWATAMKQLRA